MAQISSQNNLASLCSICEWPCKDAKQLPCKDSVCRSCLELMFSGSKSFECLNCKSMVHLPEGGVKDFPNASASDISIPCITCSICNWPCKQPKVLPCKHVNCLPCLELMFHKSKSFPCFVCQGVAFLPEGGVHAFPDFADMDKSSQSSVRKSREKRLYCFNHANDKSGHEEATFWCLNCQEYFCEACKKVHRLTPFTRTHLLDRVKEKDQSYTNMGIGGNIKSNASETETNMQDGKILNVKGGQLLSESDETLHQISATPSAIAKHIGNHSYKTEIKKIRPQKHSDYPEEVSDQTKSVFGLLEKDTLSKESLKVKIVPRKYGEFNELADVVGAVIVHNKMILALSSPAGEEHDISIIGASDVTIKILKARIFEACPKPRLFVSMYPWNDTIVCRNSGITGLKMISMDPGVDEVISFAEEDLPGGLAVSQDGKIVYSDFNWPVSIKAVQEKNTVKILCQNTEERTIFNKPWGLCVSSKGDIIVSDCGLHQVIVLNKDGDMIGIYDFFAKGSYDLFPAGICVVRNDDILVCDRNKEYIHHLSSDLRFLGFILEESDVAAIYFNDPFLFVGLGDGLIEMYQIY